ncbi:cytochrome P450 family protein [Streptomyces sp. NPDC055025]
MGLQSLHDVRTLDPLGRNLQAEAAELRGLGDLVAVELPGTIRAWVPTRHQLLKELVADRRLSKNAREHWPQFSNGWLDQRPDAQWILNWVGVQNMFTAYNSDHRRLRRLVAPSFTGRRTEALQPLVDRVTSGLLDTLAERPAGDAVDLRADFAHPLPMGVISELFGLLPDERLELSRNATLIVSTATPADMAATAIADTRALLTALVTRKRARPADDLTSHLIAARDDNDRLSEAELVDTLLLVLIAGYETTVHLIGNTVVALLSHPDQLALALTGQVPWTQVVEEVLRWAGPVTYLPLRFATEPVTAAGITIEQGEPVLAAFGAVGWDPREHGPTADQFDIRRAPSPHLAFGHGVHHCLGAPLARAEALTAVPALLRRFPALALTPGQDLTPYASFISHGYDAPTVHLA